MEIKNQKKWGLYTTIDHPELLNNLDEIEIWKRIDNLGGDIFWAQHDAGKPWAAQISLEQLIEAQYNLEYLVYSTRRFGVEFSREPSSTEHIEKSESYMAWFEFWNNHFKSMNKEVYNQFVDDKLAGKDISKYMPAGSWKDSLTKKR